MTASVDQNIRLYHWLRTASSVFPWIPVFFLYFSEITSLNGVIELSALYYFAVCIIEIPSGYFSDRIGRKPTLLISSLSLSIAYLCYLSADSFFLLAVGQVFLAAGIAFQSGTDTAFHYDSLLEAERENEYAMREARAEKYGMISLALSCLVGGSVAMLDIKLVYVVSLLGSLWMLLLVLKLKEPAVHYPTATTASSFFQMLLKCAVSLKDPLLAWLFLVVVVVYCLQHITYEFYQPYLKLLKPSFLSATGEDTTLISGVVMAGSMFGGAIGAAVSIRWFDKLGLFGLIAAAAIFQLMLVAGLALSLSVLGIALVFLRNFPMTLVHAPVNAAIAPRIGSEQRATYLSLQSLSSRLVFSLLLYLLSRSVGADEAVNWPALSSVLGQALIFGVTGVVLIFVFSIFIDKTT